MKTMRHFLLLAVVALIAGCSTTFRPWNLSEIQEGMDRAQVVRILGEPDIASIKNGAEELHYTYREDYNPALSTESVYGKDTEHAFRALNTQHVFKEYEYVVILVDGKVVNYKEL